MNEHDQPTIANAIIRRLDKEPGVEICSVPIKAYDNCISVGVLAKLDGKLIIRSRFDLPNPFEHSHLLNEIDEVAEHFKAARKDASIAGMIKLAVTPEQHIAGTGLRGRWALYG